MNFNNYNWHDSLIKRITIDRENPGLNDSIKFDIEWVEGGKAELVFKEVYYANMTLNFGIVADETILNAHIGESKDVDLVNFYSKWKGLLDDVELQLFLIELNSTGGLIKIISKAFEILDK